MKKKLIEKLKTELKIFYDCTLRQTEADVKKLKLDT
jgi:hypothetical protein